MRIEPIDIKNASEATSAALNAFRNEIRAERLPDDPPVPLEEEIRRVRTLPDFVDVRYWGGWEGGEVIAEASVTILRTAENRHLAEFEIAVRKTLRRRGLGTRMLARVADAAEREGRRLLVTTTRSTVPDGEAFLRRIGAQVGLEGHTNQLDLRDLDRDLLRRWQAQATERAAGFELLVWTGEIPEEHLEEFAAVLQAMNRAPRGALQIQDYNFTPEQIREWHRAARERGEEVWTIAAREKATGRLAGFTETVWHPNRPELLRQEATGVLPEFQNRGLGRWMKAAMLEKVLRERPQVTRIRTGNADSNAPMLKINYELGFKPYISTSAWQVDLAQVRAYLDGVRATV
ncbi:MAG: GNAT family N-acetyltransferase [Armatimonadota bacterium]|nr:GNAT family N-acetyltransferase [Armatimonadota bacterium]MDR7466183.1 GNAT family N-acetyltransferase [Armatimonadota bacterium]MDR7495134.1 GNAT family N-acetyltransferase [Armatimonadota bacterium]MDR7505796.1 GNAT family N-acetyltransferase [Armatimonadota bacterium]MDR7546198.1 GNAT family N-acetyltransferase [Armatimonadota bacterium]